jgi:dTDP-4-amino-4,6-dideoxy-D-galactose acyltransferase
VRDDAWLAERLGLAALWWEPGDDPAAVAAAARARAPAFAQARVPAADVAALAALHDAGFGVVDATVTMAGRGPSAATDAGVEVRDAVPGDAPVLLDVAERHYDVSRFHLDPAIPDAVAGAVKRAWLQAYFDGTRGDRLLTALAGGRPAGFLAGLRRADGTWIVDLVAVHPRARGRGAGRALVAALAPAGERVEAGTQLANVGALRFYGGLGFTIAATAYVLHLHAR